MGYQTGSDVWVSMNPISYQVIHSEPDKLILKNNEQDGQEVELIKINGQWLSPDLPGLSFQIDPIFPTDPYITYEFTNQLDLDDLLNFCQTDSEINKLCQSDDFWKNRLLSKFGNKLEGLFASGKENLPILEGHHSISDYIYVEQELTKAMSDVALLGHEEYLENVVNEDTGDFDFDINIIMYILRHFETNNYYVFKLIVDYVVSSPYPDEFILEFLENMHDFNVEYDDEAWVRLVLSSDGSYYNDIWARIFELGTFPDWLPDYMVGHEELENNEDLQNLAKKYL